MIRSRRRVALRAQALLLAVTLCAACAGSRHDTNASSSAAATDAAGTGAASPGAIDSSAPLTNVAAANAVATNSATGDGFGAAPTSQPSFSPVTDALLAPQAGSSYQLIIGPATIDDGVGAGTVDTGKAVANVGNTVAGLFSSGTTPPDASGAPPSVVAARALAAKIPASEYDLGELAKTLPDDPIAIYRVVTDQIALDGYDGVMRGPLVTWMSRAGGPTDKVALLAYLFLSKGIAYQFVRGSLSDDERARLAQAAASAPAVAQSTNPDAAAYTRARIKDGTVFAAWARGLLTGQRVSLGNAVGPAAHFATRHYWMQIDRGGKLLDLDPTIAGTTEGTHLATLDPSFKPWAAIPPEEWHRLQIRVLATYADGTRKTLFEHIDTVPNLAYTPIRVAFAPAGSGSDPAKPTGATAFEGGLKIGGGSGDRAHVELGGANAATSLALEIRRKAPDGTVVTLARRALLDAGLPVAERADRLAGMTTIIVAPGSGATAFTLHEQALALVQLAHDVADAKAGKTPAPHDWYPIRIADFFGRDDAIAAALATNATGRLYRDRPDVAMQRTWFSPAANGTANAVNVFDVADNGMASTAGQSDAAVDANLTRAYADTAMERDVVEDGGPPGTIGVFAAADKQNSPPTVSLRSAAGDGNDPLRAGLDQTFASGQVAIVPQHAVAVDGTPAFGWWAIDPGTGNGVGRMTGGFGQDLAEESVTINTISRAYTLYGQLQTGATCMQKGFASVGCVVAVCGSIASYVFGGGTALKLASNYAAGEVANAGCASAFGGGK